MFNLPRFGDPYVGWLIDQGLRTLHTCTTCKFTGAVEYPEWTCQKCESKISAPPRNSKAEIEFTQYLEDRDIWLNDAQAARPSRTGSGEWANGFEMFALPREGDPENRTAYSLRDFETKLKKTNLNEDGVTTWDKQPPRFLKPHEESQG